MKFKQYLNEYKDEDKDKVHVSRFKSSSEEEIKSLLETSIYKKSLEIMIKNQSWIYRGNRNLSGDFFTYEKSNVQRMSQNTKNYYTLMINNAPSWKAYPIRQYICSTNSMKAKDYTSSFGQGNELYVLIPRWGTVVGVCEKRDVFDCWESGTGFWTGRLLNNAIDDIFNEVEDITDVKVNNFNEFKKLCKKVDDNEDVYTNWSNKFVKYWLNSDKKFFDFLNDVMSPKNNDFSITKIGPNYSVADDNEVWFNDNGIAISVYEFKKMYPGKNEDL